MSHKRIKMTHIGRMQFHHTCKVLTKKVNNVLPLSMNRNVFGLDETISVAMKEGNNSN